MEPDAIPRGLRTRWLYIFAAAIVILAIGTIVLLLIAFSGFLEAGNDAMSKM